MPPLICPPPPDCPLYEQRIAYSPDEPLRRAILTERRNSSDLAELIRAEAPTAPPPLEAEEDVPSPPEPVAPPTRPALPAPTPPPPFSILDQLQKETQ